VILRRDQGGAAGEPPVKLLVVAHDAGIGGAQLSLLEIIERLDPAQFEAIVLVPTPGVFLTELRRRGIACYWGLTQRWIFFHKPFSLRILKARPWRLLGHPHVLAALSWLTMPLRVMAIAIFARAKGVHLVYSNTATVLDGALVATLLRLPHVWHLRESVESNTDLRFPCPVAWLPGFILRTSTIAIVNSCRLARDLFGTVQDEKIRLIRNGVDLGAFGRDSPARPPLPVPGTARLTAICGRLTANKGVDVYLRAMGRLKDSHPDLNHLIIGEGSEAVTGQLTELAERLGLQDRVHFLGQRQDVTELFNAVDVVISASVRESFGRTLLEAMACGVPVVATRSGGPEEIIVDGQSGFLVTVGDAAAMAKCVAELLDDPALEAAMRSAGKARVRDHFNLDDTSSAVVRSFQHALGVARGLPKNDCS